MDHSQTNGRSGSPTTPKRLLIFVVTTFTATWLAYLPLILGHIDLRSPAGILLIILGGGAPSLTAVVLSARWEGSDGLKRLWRSPPGNYLTGDPIDHVREDHIIT